MRWPKGTIPQPVERRADTEANLAVIIDDGLPPELTERVRALLGDLAGGELSMVLLDLAQLYRALTPITYVPAHRKRLSSAPMGGGIIRALIYAEDGKTIAEECQGPDWTGGCRRVGLGCAAACAGKWIMARGWRFRVAPDAESCPLAILGYSRRQLAASAVPPAGAPIMSPEDVFGYYEREAPSDRRDDMFEELYRPTLPRLTPR